MLTLQGSPSRLLFTGSPSSGSFSFCLRTGQKDTPTLNSVEVPATASLLKYNLEPNEDRISVKFDQENNVVREKVEYTLRT